MVKSQGGPTPKLSVKDLTIRYGNEVALQNVTLDIQENEIFGIIGPANSGKTSFLRALNRMDVMMPGMKVPSQALARWLFLKKTAVHDLFCSAT